MKTHLAIFIICSSLAGLCQGAEDDRPVLHETPARLVAVIDSTGRVNFAAACLNVSRDVAQKRLRLYAVTLQAKTGLRKIEGCDVDVIYNYELVSGHKTSAGAYHVAHNSQVFSFAIAQYAAGKKMLGLRLVRLIAEADPEFWWSSPTHPPFTIKNIIAGLEKEDESVKELLIFETEQWADTLKKYGP